VFYLLAIVLCLAVLSIVLAGSSLLCAFILSAGKRWLHLLPARACAAWVFGLRTLPFFLAALITLGFALPAFFRFEPRSSNESIGPRLLGLASLGALVIAVVAVRSWRIIRASHRAQKEWRACSRPVQIGRVLVPVYCGEPSPLLAVTGLLQPQIFVSEKVMTKLSPGELAAAIAHEVAHVNALDNLKHLILKITRGPEWLKLGSTWDGMWLAASEAAADEGALAGGASALDLSSALVKVAAFSREFVASDRIAASHFLPLTTRSSLEARVNHLCYLLENEKPLATTETGGRKWWPVLCFLMLIGSYAASVNAILPWTYEILELLVR
jgi:Zn-dependent protease with chaperone function